MEMEIISFIVDIVLHYIKALGSFISPIPLCPTKKSSFTLTIFILTSTNLIQALISSHWGIVLPFLLAVSPSSIPLPEETVLRVTVGIEWFPKDVHVPVSRTCKYIHGKREWRLQMELSLLVSRPWYGEVNLDYPGRSKVITGFL